MVQITSYLKNYTQGLGLKLSIPCVILTVLTLAQLFMCFTILSEQKNDGAIMNLAGRQRMLTQKISKEVMIYSRLEEAKNPAAEQSAKQVRDTMEIFSLTLNALMYSGNAPLSLNLADTKYRTIPAAKGELLEQLQVIEGLWNTFSKHVDNALTLPINEAEADLNALKKQNLPLLKEMNKAVQIMQKISEQHTDFVSWFQYGSMITTLLCIAVLVLIINAAINHLNNDVNLLKLTSAITRVISDDIQRDSKVVARFATGQASSVESISASIEEMSSVAQSNNENVKSSRESTRDCRNSAEQGLQEILTLEQCVQQANSATGELTSTMQNIKDANDEVSKVIKTIDEIAFQTNILALNAAVEAARAGEAGAGFAVVANEVRALALRSAKAAQETNKLISSSIEKSKDAVSVSDKVVNTLKIINDQSSNIHSNFTTIVEKVGGVDKGFDEITTATDEQTVGMNDIRNSVLEIEKSAQDSVSHANQLSHFSDYLSNEAHNLHALMLRELKLVFGADAVKTEEEEEAQIRSVMDTLGQMETPEATISDIETTETTPRSRESQKELEDSFF
ncbi:MAG: methyl-accepting chemotaxis protein [Verrucomicrobiota bacterium]